MKRWQIASGGLLILLLLSFAGNAAAAECSIRFRNSLAKAIAAREKAAVNLQIARAHEQLEATYQAQLTATLEAKYAAMTQTVFVQSIRPIIRAELDKQLEEARKDRSRASSRALESREKAVESAQKKFTKAFNRVPTLNCTP